MVVRNYQCQRKISYSNTTSIQYWVISHDNYSTENSNQYPVSKLQVLVSLWNSHAMLKILFFQQTNGVQIEGIKIITQHFRVIAVIAFQNESFHVQQAISCMNILQSEHCAKFILHLVSFMFQRGVVQLLAHVQGRQVNQSKPALHQLLNY